MTSQLDPSSYRQLFLEDTFPSVIIDIASDSILDLNRAFEELTSRSAKELHGLPFQDVLDQAVPWVRARRKGTADLRLEQSDHGPWRLVRLRRIGAEAQERRRDRIEALASMAAGIAHEFNNALMAALPWADLLRRQRESDPAVQEATAHIRKAISRAADITSQLLDFAPPAIAQPAPFELNSLVEGELRLAAPLTAEHITVSFHRSDEAMPIETDRFQIAIVLQHILRNAREAIDGEGTIRVGVSRLDASRRQEHSLSTRREFAEVEVTDNGSGIAADRIDQVFDPFFTTKETRRSAGLGLSVALRIVEHHGGTMDVESELGSGTTVRLFLPLMSASESIQGPSLHLLVIDDDSSIAGGIKASLELSGARVTTAGSGEEAIVLINNGFTPDGIVLDMVLPGMQGSAVHGVIRSTLPEVPIIISSGWTSSREASGLLASPHTTLMQKPYEPEDLLVRFESFRRNRDDSALREGEN